jgi:hypothetical protein
MRALVLALGLVAAASTASAQTPAPAAKALDVSGKWAVAMELSIGTSNPTLVLKQDGTKVTGTYTGRYGESKLTGTIDDKRQLVFQVALSAEGMDVTMFFSGEVSADGQMIAKGVVNIEGLGEGTWAARKDKSQNSETRSSTN